MDKQEKLLSTFSQKPGAPHNFAKFQQNENTPDVLVLTKFLSWTTLIWTTNPETQSSSLAYDF